MKISVDIADQILDGARKVAARDRVTLKALVEQGLRWVLAEREGSAPFLLRRATFKGDGLQEGVKDTSWDHIREAAYERHGG